MKRARAEETPTPTRAAGWIGRLLPAGIVVVGLVLGYAFGLHEYLSLEFLAQSREALAAQVAAHPILAPAAFFVAYTLAVAFSFPAASVLSIFGGFLFGWVLGSLLVAFAATIGASAIFLVARSAFGDALRRRVGARAQQFAKGLEDNAFSYLLILRLAPVFPFFVVNIAPALFDVRLRSFVAATFIGILPGVFAYTYLGQGLDGVLERAAQADQAPSLGDIVTLNITLAFAALALVAALPLVIRHLRGRAH